MCGNTSSLNSPQAQQPEIGFRQQRVDAHQGEREREREQMRFHHSTRRGRHHSAPSHQQHSNSTRWSQLNHCRETNIYFHRRLPVENPATSFAFSDDHDETGPPMALLANATTTTTSTTVGNNQIDQMVDGDEHQQPADKKRGELEPTSQNDDLDLESLREKLVAQVQKHPFWSNKAAKRMQIQNVKRRNVYIYELESYCERRDLEWNFEPYRGGLSGGSVTPYRSYELPAWLAASASQPTTPLKQATLAGASGSNQFVWSGNGAAGPADTNNNGTPIRQHQAVATTTSTPTSSKGPVSRSLSSGLPSSISQSYQSSSSVAAAAASGSPSLVYEPISARLEQLIPSPEFVWSIDVSATVSQQRGRRLPTTTSPSCVSSELPNSSFVKRCHGCQGRGKLKCNLCHGVGYEVCLSCSGKGTSRSYSSGGRSSNYSRSGDRYSSSNYDRGDPDQFLGGGNGGGIGGAATDGNSRNSRYANGDEQSSSGFSNSLGGWSTESCSTCHGAGQKRCWVCAGKSYNNCPGCIGTGSLRCFLTLTVSWLNHCDDVIINNSDQIIPKERLRICSGLLLVDQVEDRLKPLKSTTLAAAKGDDDSLLCRPNQLQQQQLNEGCRAEAEQLHLASKHLLEKHRNTYKCEKFLKQRHKVTQIECHIVSYEWKQRYGQFVIYGEERKVYIGKYPFKSFCNLI